MFLSRTDSSNRRIYAVLIGKLYLRNLRSVILMQTTLKPFIMGNCQLQTGKQFPDLPQGSVAPNRHDECVSSCGHSSKAKGSGWDQMGARPASRRPHPHTTSPNPLPPMAGKGTEGHGETAEKTRHTRVQPLNTDVTVKALEDLRSLLKWYICLAAPWECAACAYTRKECTHLYCG